MSRAIPDLTSSRGTIDFGLPRAAPRKLPSQPRPPAGGGCIGERLEYEHLDRQVGVDVIVAHETDHFATGQLFDLAADVRLHDALPESAKIEHGCALAGICQRPLPAREAV